MRRAAYCILAAVLATGAYGAIPTKEENWYTPEKFSIDKVDGTLEFMVFDKYGNVDTVRLPVKVDEDGQIFAEGDESSEYEVFDTISYRALQAFVLAKRNKERIETLGKNLHNLGLADGIDIVGTDPNGKEHRYTMSFTAKKGIRDSLSDGSRPELTDPSKSWNMADERTLHWRTDNKMELLGADAATSSTDEWWNDYGFSVPFLKETGALGWKKYGGWHPSVFGTMTNDGRTMLTLAGWTGGHECKTYMKDILTEKSGDNRANHYVLTRYGTGSNAVFHYVPFGDRLELENGSPVDGYSITTNLSDGASTQGEASLYGWGIAEPGDIPLKGESGLEWSNPGNMVDGSSLAAVEAGDGTVWEVKDAHVYATTANHYFGTGLGDYASLGWHELPNVTTNMVTGDELTVTCTVDSQVPDIKRLGLRGWNPNWMGPPAFMVNVGGRLDYMLLSSLTNMTACTCTQKWDEVLSWIDGGAAIGEDGGLELPGYSIDDYLINTFGFVWSAVPDDLYFENSNPTNIQASFDAPVNWADGTSLEVADGKYQIIGFPNGRSCKADISSMLADPESTDAQSHKLLAWYKPNADTPASLHFLPMGEGVGAVDDITITTNTNHGAVENGVATLYGWTTASNGTYLAKTEDGSLAWQKIEVTAGDGSLTNISANVLAITGFAVAQPGSIPVKTDNGLEWMELSDELFPGGGGGSGGGWTLCPIHNLAPVNGFCPADGCPHSGYSAGATRGGTTSPVSIRDAIEAI